jgi:hypothetical protein
MHSSHMYQICESIWQMTRTDFLVPGLCATKPFVLHGLHMLLPNTRYRLEQHHAYHRRLDHQPATSPQSTADMLTWSLWSTAKPRQKPDCKPAADFDGPTPSKNAFIPAAEPRLAFSLCAAAQDMQTTRNKIQRKLNGSKSQAGRKQRSRQRCCTSCEVLTFLLDEYAICNNISTTRQDTVNVPPQSCYEPPAVSSQLHSAGKATRIPVFSLQTSTAADRTTGCFKQMTNLRCGPTASKPPQRLSV